MFTGIVEELGTVAALADLGDAARITVRAPLVTADAASGDSIAVNGVCLTVVDVEEGTFTADVMKETLDRSALGGLAAGDPVNLERAATLATRLGGHLVQGHVDGVGVIRSREPAREWERVTISLPPGLARYVVEKGSIVVDGVPLTVASVSGGTGSRRARPEPVSGEASTAIFTVSLIPTTLKLTTLGGKGAGEPVNLEVDVIAKYVEKLVGER